MTITSLIENIPCSTSGVAKGEKPSTSNAPTAPNQAAMLEKRLGRAILAGQYKCYKPSIPEAELHSTCDTGQNLLILLLSSLLDHGHSFRQRRATINLLSSLRSQTQSAAV
jgi:hypothetical protein